MFANPLKLSSSALEFMPQGAASPQFKQQQYYQGYQPYPGVQQSGVNTYYTGGYPCGYYGDSMQSIPATHSFASTAALSTPGAINLDEFSDLSDSDSDDEAPRGTQVKAPAETAKLTAPGVDVTFEAKEPAEEPSPCALDVQSLKNDTEDATSSELQDASSLSSEPEEELDHEDPAGPVSPEAVFSLRQMLQWREWVLEHEQPTILYRTQPVESSPPQASWRMQESAPICSQRTQSKGKLLVSDNSWAAKQRRLHEFGDSVDLNAHVARSIKSILNKLTLEKFAKLTQQLLACGISTSSHVEILIHEVFEKATTQHHYIDMYTDLCVLLHEHFTVNPFEGAGSLQAGRKLTFKRLLLDECQMSFERLLAPPEGLDELAPEERTAAEVGYKTHMLGNIKLVGGLLSRGMLASKVGIAILEELLSNPTPEALESAAALLTTLGPTADCKEWPQYTALNAIFDQISTIVKTKKCQPRERFLLKDLLELRAAGWVTFRPRRLERAMTLSQVADSAAGRRVEPQAIRMVSPAAPVFDQDKFREGAKKALVELRYSGCLTEALARLVSLGVPPVAEQAAELAQIASHVVQEGAAPARESGMKVMLELAGSKGWSTDALCSGITLFVEEIAPDLCYDVPGLQKILSEELSTILSTSTNHRPAWEILSTFQAQ